MTQPKHVLVIKTSSMGDVIHTLPALTDAAAAIAGIRFDWVVEEAFAEIPTWHPAVERVIPVAIRRWRKSLFKTWRSGEWRQFKEHIGANHYDAVIDAQGLLKSALLTRKASGPSFGLNKDSAREPIASRFYQFPQAVAWDQHAVERVRQLFAQSLGYPLEQTSGRFLLNQALFPKGQVQNTPYVVFIHGTTWASKHWPESHWLALAKKVNQAGFHVVLPWGNECEKARAERIAGAGEAVTVLPRLSLAKVAGVISEARAVVAVDTGLGHLTAALETPAVSLYGPTSPARVGAYGHNQRHLTLAECPKADTENPSVFTPMTPNIVWQSLRALLTELHEVTTGSCDEKGKILE